MKGEDLFRGVLANFDVSNLTSHFFNSMAISVAQIALQKESSYLNQEWVHFEIAKG